MAIEITACQTPDDVVAAVTPVMHYFGATPQPQDTFRFVPFIEPSRAFMARENGVTVGGCGSFPLEQTVPGGVVKTAGLSVVGVMPTHRRRGILKQMMRAQLDDVHARGEALASLWASEDTIYGQFGYGAASFCADIEVSKAMTAFALPFESRGEFQKLGEQEAYGPLAEVYDRVRREHPGMIARSEEWWRNRRLADPENRRMGGGEQNRVVLRLDGKPMGYALYRVFQVFEGGSSNGHVQVIEAIGDGPEATREIWRFVLDIDWVARVKAMLLPLDHPLMFIMARPRELKLRVHDGLWVRLVDVPAALKQRTLGKGDPVVLEVADAFCPWNAGRWKLSPAGAEKTTAAAEIACDVTALGSAYLGGFTFRQMVRAGRVQELKAGAAARVDALLPADRAPWCPEIF